MANEIYIPSIGTGKTVTVQLYQGSSAIGGSFAATEIGTTGNYFASMPANTPFGQYFISSTVSGSQVASGQILWDGAYEIPVGLSVVQGLNPLAPATTTQTQLTAGNINIAITGNQIDNTTLSRI